MGVVYKARDTRLNRSVAIKVLPADQVSDPERKRRFPRVDFFRRLGLIPGELNSCWVVMPSGLTGSTAKISKAEGHEKVAS